MGDARRARRHANAQELGWLAYTDRVREPMDRHTVDRMLGLLGPLGVEASQDMRLYADPQAVSDVVMEYPEPYAVVAPTSRWAAKALAGGSVRGAGQAFARARRAARRRRGRPGRTRAVRARARPRRVAGPGERPGGVDDDRAADGVGVAGEAGGGERLGGAAHGRRV
ncbi:MAG: hypothetical protein R3B49_03765 [Phycisphaerales bacterium]